MTYQMFQQGPSVYLPVILVSLGITLLAYGAFPVIFAQTRKKIITKKKYTILCYCINFFVMISFIAVNGKSSGMPYILWTGAFSAIGLGTLRKRGVLEGFQFMESQNRNQELEGTSEAEEIRFCRKCGTRLPEGANFCKKCGVAVIKEE
ncbi:MAG: zinc ribbon domain-containing protein [Oscillospiraceae bacterium]|nr:zinc ribbon domain-containing protein [Oscillospiraceae bacterium]